MSEPRKWPQDALDGQDAEPTLRLWQPGQSRSAHGSLSLELTLGEIYDRYYEPVILVMRDARPRNLEATRLAVKFWRLYTGDPPLAEISAYHSRDFVVALKARAGRKYATLGNNTVRKLCGVIQAILDLCGPADRQHREAIGLYATPADVPFLPLPPKEAPSGEDGFTFDEQQLLVDHADAARLPDTLPSSAGTYFCRLYVILYNTTMRIGGAMGATWKCYHGDHLILPARVVAKGRRAQRIELNQVAQQVIESMRGCGRSGDNGERIFPWPWAWPASRHQLHDQHSRILDAAGFPADRRFGFHGIRKLSNMSLARINAKACEKALGHAAGRTNVENYTSRQLVAESLAKLPVLRLSRQRQRVLFE